MADEWSDNQTAGASGLSGLLGGLENRHSSRVAWSRTKRILQNSIRWRQQDMIAAGINPILGHNNSASGSGPQTAPSQLDKSMTNVLHGKRLSQDKLLQTSVITANNEQARKTHQEGITSAEQAREIGLRADLLDLDLTRARNVQQLEEDWPAIQKIERVLRMIGPAAGAIGGGLIGGGLIKKLLGNFMKKGNTVKKAIGVTPPRGYGRVPNRAPAPDVSKKAWEKKNQRKWNDEDFIHIYPEKK